LSGEGPTGRVRKQPEAFVKENDMINLETGANPDFDAPAKSRSWLKTTTLLALGALALVALLYFGSQAAPYVEQFKEWVKGLGVWAPVAFILGYIVATLAFLPGAILTAAAGAIFGLLWGTVYVFVGASIGACAAFLVARYVARSWVERKIEGQPKFQAIDRAVVQEGGKIVALLRLTPVVPFNLLNYALGLTKVRLADYALACFAMLPGTFLYVYLGSITEQAASGRSQSVLEWVFRVVGLAATFAVTWLITKKAKQALAEQADLETADV
jgi:uncharacterized membrane protein YdjX (TVP38/TMEM64 family)